MVLANASFFRHPPESGRNMPARDDRNLRFELVRLYQAIEQTKRGRSQTSPHARSLVLNGSLRGERTTCILRGIEENRRERVRLRERLPFQYSENLSRVHRRSLMSAKRPEEGLLEWLLDVTEERTPDSQKASGMRLRIHCEESKRGWVYLVGLLGSGPPDSYGSSEHPRTLLGGCSSKETRKHAYQR